MSECKVLLRVYGRTQSRILQCFIPNILRGEYESLLQKKWLSNFERSNYWEIIFIRKLMHFIRRKIFDSALRIVPVKRAERKEVLFDCSLQITVYAFQSPAIDDRSGKKNGQLLYT